MKTDRLWSDYADKVQRFVFFKKKKKKSRQFMKDARVSVLKMKWLNRLNT